ncbi:MAG: WGxxGxxG-CTERM domain-containing protein [Aphanothece sp. CMT-3BRIN-NPC111]|jgi:MYXO-CTERM domain-containing protein|nr:WGxxGxxG-CTERM domain-containing protein [Aphanothece sp. CMT-3BRIN-NPC111]
MKRSDLSKVGGVGAKSAITSGFAIAALTIVPLAVPVSVNAEAPLGESYTPPRQLPENTPPPQAPDYKTPPRQEVYNTQSRSDSDWGWLGLLGLIGLLGLARRKQEEPMLTREPVGSDRRKTRI